MWHNAIFASTLLLPATLALQIDSHLATSTTLLCSTIYDASSLPGSIPTTTVSLQQTLDLSPVILHNYTSVTSTVTPKPFSTLFSVLATKTKTIEKEAINGTFYTTETRFGTSTVWEHATTTKTETRTRLLTSRTTEWIDAPTGFVGVRNNTIFPAASSASSAAQQKQKRTGKAAHPHSKRQTSQKPKLVQPTQGKYAVEIGCQQWVGIHTTEVLLLTAKKTATVTLRPETVYKNRTVYGTITSTILVSSASGSSSSSTFPSSSAATPSSANAQNKRGGKTTTPITSKRSLASIAMALISPLPLASPTSTVTNTTTVTKTPYTISFTWTRTITTTTTATLHATTTLTSYSACATSNLLSQTSNNKRINGVSFAFSPSGEPQLQTTRLESLCTETAALCCETCISRGKECLWSVWQAEGQASGSCYLTLLAAREQSKDVQQARRETEAEVEAEKEQQTQQCPTQSQKAIFGYSGRNGEVRYVVSNGLCGFLSEA